MTQKTNLQRALDLSRNIFIQACAGAGKTFALTKRYCSILDDFAAASSHLEKKNWSGPENILVITFTRKAAGEMSRRIYQDLRLLMDGEIPDNLNEQGIDHCPHLRDPNYTGYRHYLEDAFSQNAISTIDSFCSAILKENAHRMGLDPQFTVLEDMDSRRFLDTTLDVWLKKCADDRHPALNIIAENYSLFNFKESLRLILTHREKLDTTLAGLENRSEEQIWQDWLEDFTPDYDPDPLIQDLEKLISDAETLCTDKSDNGYKALKKMSEDLEKLSEKNALEKRAEFISSVLIGSDLTKNTLDFKKNFPGAKPHWKDSRSAADQYFESLKNSIPDEWLAVTPGPGDQQAIPVLKALVELYRDFETFLTAQKRLRNVLDFSDVILLSRQLLMENPETARQLSQRYSHILVDEFQDTNPARWDIIRQIASPDGKLRPKGLFIVGDRKQSIYRFNNADVTIMNDAEDLIRETYGDIIQFDDNFRAVPDFVEKGINSIFGIRKLFPGKDDEHRDFEAYFEPSIPRSKKTAKLQPVIKAHYLLEEDAGDEESARHTAMVTAAVIDDMKKAGIYNESQTMIGVLLRDFTRITHLQKAFEDRRIPYHIVSGRGFFQTNPARDTGFFLSVMCNPYDDLNLAGLLRSPLIGISDTDLARLAACESDSLFNALKNDSALRPVFTALEKWQKELRICSPEDVLIRILDKDLHELGYVCELSPRQNLANMDKALHLLRKQILKGATLTECRDFFTENTRDHLREAQADYPSDSPVQIMTIHKSKGLEFPVVIMPDMNRKPGGRKNNLRFGQVKKNFEITLKPEDAVKPGVMNLISLTAAQEDEAERKRLFYVAVTRAIHQVHFIGAGEAAKEKAKILSDWDLFVKPVFGLPEAPEDWQHEDLNILTASQIPEISAESSVNKRDFSLPEKISSARIIHTLSPHDLMPEQTSRTYTAQSDNGADLSMSAGNCFHSCMEKNIFDLSGHEDDLENDLRDLSENEKKAVLFQCGSLLELAKDHSVIRESAEALEIYRELPVSGRLEGKHHILLVNGIIDCLYRTPDGWIVLDYKTDKDDSYVENYRHQIRSYLWMIKQIFSIDAAGKIYFVRLNTVVDVNWDNNYFDSLPYGDTYRPRTAASHIPVSRIDSSKQLILCPGKYCARQVKNALIHAGKLTPAHEVTTLKELMRRCCPSKDLSARQLSLLLRKKYPELTPGQADLLVSASESSLQGKGLIKHDFIIYAKALNIFRKDHNSLSLTESLSQTQCRLQNADSFFFYNPIPAAPVFRSLQNATVEFPALPKEKSFKLMRAFSPAEEVLKIARDIITKDLQPEDVMIACSSLDVYRPHIERLFPQFGLSAFFSDRNTLLTSSAASLVLALAKLRGTAVPKWSDAAPVLLHPLMPQDPRLLMYDAAVRQDPFKKRPLPDTVLNFIEKYGQKDLLFSDCLSELLQKYATAEKIKRLGLTKEIDTILNTVRDLEHDIKHFDLKLSRSHFFSELTERLKSGQRKSDIRREGVHICSFLNSMGAEPQHLYVTGMTSDMIPRHETANPYLQITHDLSYELNRFYFNTWCNLNSNVIFSAPEQAEDGSVLQPSLFLEQISCAPYEPQPLPSLREHLLKYENSLIVHGPENITDRFNALKTGDAAYRGNTSLTRDRIVSSATRLDTLLACPMKYFFSDFLNIKEPVSSEDGAAKMELGTVIHAVLECFGKAGGFDQTGDERLDTLKRSCEHVMGEFGLDPEDPIVKNRFRYYLNDLRDGSESNLLIRVLKWHDTAFRDYRADEFEWEFNTEEDNALEMDDFCIPVTIRGKIDKILLSETDRSIIASDYKTGNINNKDLDKHLKSQLYLYMRKLSEHYPHDTVRSAYEIINDPNSNKNAKIYEIINGNLICHKRSVMSLTEFEDYLGKRIESVAKGNYPLTERPEKDVCEKCAFRGICRRDTLM